MSKHKHEWVLIDSTDSSKRPAPKSYLPKGRWVTTGGLFGGTFYSGPSVREINEDISRRVVETIQRSYEPTSTSQTWACHCGRMKRYVQEHDSLWKKITRPPEQS